MFNLQSSTSSAAFQRFIPKGGKQTATSNFFSFTLPFQYVIDSKISFKQRHVHSKLPKKFEVKNKYGDKNKKISIFKIDISSCKVLFFSRNKSPI